MVSFISSSLLLLLVIHPAYMMGGVIKLALLHTASEKGVTRTQPPEQEVKVAPTYYKDYYQKTKVVVTHPVSTVLYNPSDYSSVLREDHDLFTDDYQSVHNASTVSIQSSMRETIVPTRKYDEFDWPTEVQMFTQPLNVTATVNVTTTVVNSIPFM